VEAPELIKLFRPERELQTTKWTRRSQRDKSAKRVAQTMLLSLVLGLVVAAVGASPRASQALLWSLACSGVGWVVGFLFGIPRTPTSDSVLTRTGQAQTTQPQSVQSGHSAPTQPPPSQQPDQPQPAQQPKAQPAQQPDQAQPSQPPPSQQPDQPQPHQEPDQQQAGQDSRDTRIGSEVNTNLEQISDWLTKIIVGVTLVELNPVIARLEQAATLIAKSLGEPSTKGVSDLSLSFGYAIMVYFVTSGFLGSYLLTRLFLQPAFGRVR
jgi:DNA polymerase III gamma/tau subunit